MIDWDEINWGKGIAIILAGVIVVGAGIFVMNDYLSSQRLRDQLSAQIEDLNNFYSTWEAPSEIEIAKLEQERNQMMDQVESAPFAIPDTIDPIRIENLIREQAQRSGVKVSEVALKAEDSRGFFKANPFVVSFTGNEEPVATFLRLIEMLPYAVQTEASRLTFGETMNIKVNFFTFDTQGWDEFYKCKLSVTIPQIDEVNIDKVFVFKGNLAQLKSEVGELQSSLKQTKQAVNRECEIEREKGALEEKIRLIEELTSE